MKKGNICCGSNNIGCDNYNMKIDFYINLALFDYYLYSIRQLQYTIIYHLPTITQDIHKQFHVNCTVDIVQCSTNHFQCNHHHCPMSSHGQCSAVQYTELQEKIDLCSILHCREVVFIGLLCNRRNCQEEQFSAVQLNIRNTIQYRTVQ